MPKVLKIPPVNLSPSTLTEEAFENVREWRRTHNEKITKEDLEWYYADLEQEKKDAEAFKAALEAPVKPEDDLGPMPSHGTPEFWSWCRKRKEIRLQKEAAIIAAGGTIEKPKKEKKANPVDTITKKERSQKKKVIADVENAAKTRTIIVPKKLTTQS
jgi:hypothetical protein